MIRWQTEWDRICAEATVIINTLKKGVVHRIEITHLNGTVQYIIADTWIVEGRILNILLADQIIATFHAYDVKKIRMMNK